MKLLVLDSVPAASSVIAHDLKKAFGLQTFHASSAEEARKRLETEKDAVGILIFFLDEPEMGLAFIRDVRELCEIAEIRCPNFVVLTPGDLDAAYLRRFRMAGAECRVYGSSRELCTTVRRLIFERRSENGRPTIVVERTVHRTKFYLLGSAGRELLAYGPRLLPLMNFFAINFGTELSTAQLAEAADILIGSVRVYLMRLRVGYEQTSKNVGVTVPANAVFCTMRKDGAFVHVFKARVIFI